MWQGKIGEKIRIAERRAIGNLLITETLASHPDILAHGEIFHEKVEWHIRAEFAAANDLSKRERDPVGFARDVLSQNFGRKVVALKCGDRNPNRFCDYVLGDPSIIKIILERENRLAHMASWILAGETNIWNIRSENHFDPSVRSRKISFPEKTFLEFVAWHVNVFQYYRKPTRWARLFT